MGRAIMDVECPVCGEPADEEFRPFCSEDCKIYYEEGGEYRHDRHEGDNYAALISAAPDLLRAAQLALEKCAFPVGSMQAKQALENAVEKATSRPVAIPGAFRSARGIIPYKPGDELPEEAIRRVRGKI